MVFATYFPTIPQPTDNPSFSQPQLLSNFTSLNQQISIDHVALNAGSDNGDHKQITFNANNIPPGPFPLAKSVLFTNKQSPVPPTKNLNELFFYPAGANVAESSQQYVSSQSGSTYLLGGIIMKWGIWTLAPGVPSATITFAGQPFPNAIFTLVLGSNVSNNPANLPIWVDGTLTKSGFTGARVGGGSSGGTYTYNYIAIGN